MDKFLENKTKIMEDIEVSANIISELILYKDKKGSNSACLSLAFNEMIGYNHAVSKNYAAWGVDNLKANSKLAAMTGIKNLLDEIEAS